MCPAVCTGQGELGLKVDRRQCFLCHYLYWGGGGQMTPWLLYLAILLFCYSTIHSSLMIHIFIHHIQSSIYSYIKLTLNHLILGVGIPVAKHGMITVVPALTI